jgi:autotransporter-associated beta strand protein
MKKVDQTRPDRQLGTHLLPALLPCVIAVTLAACGGGSSNVKSTPIPSTPPPTTPPPTTPPPTGSEFTPTVSHDTSLVVAPPSVPTLAAASVLPQYSTHLELTNAAGALGAGLTGQGVTIGFVDSGVNRDHPALSGRVTRHFIHVSSANNTSVDDVVGHGTVVAQMAAGKGSGNWGGGVAQSAGIVSSRIIADRRPEDDGSGAGNEIFAGQGYGGFFRDINNELADAGAKIINNSWGGLYWNDPALTRELAMAWKDFVVRRGGIVVFANGNSGTDSRYVGNPSDNARLPTLANDAELEKGWLTVGALDPTNPTQLTSYSQHCGTAMNYCLVAPGNAVFIDPQAKVGDTSISLYQGGGTSYAAPQVSGAAAVVWAAFPYFTNDQVRQTILGGAKDLGAPGVDPVFGWGLLDVTKAAMGPSHFAWGDFSVSFTGHSIWRNEIIGSGGLVKNGAGTLTLTEAAKFTGATQVNAGALDVRKGMQSSLSVAAAGSVWASGVFSGNVNSSGKFLSAANTPASIKGNFTQSSTGNTGVWLGSPLQIDGSATLNGTISILGVKSGYVTSSKETLLTAESGVNGTFSTVKAASNVFLDASLAYDPKHVFLNINRIDVSKAVAGAGLGGIALMSAGRVESAMQAIDTLLTDVSPGGLSVSDRFIGAAGALQQSATLQQADGSLRSVSGELHAASDALTMDGIAAGRRALISRLDTLTASPVEQGSWARNLSSGGELAQAGFDSVGLSSSGDMVGHDWALGRTSKIGVAMTRMQQHSWLSALGDQSRGHQQDMQLYASSTLGTWQLRGAWSAGQYQRQMQRNLMLGDLREQVATQFSGNYQQTFAELGRHFSVAGISMTPYVGVQQMLVRHDAFAEQSETGFGLRASAWTTERTQGLAGVRATRAWQLGDMRLQADAYAEWQRQWSADGQAFAASFTGIEQWLPLQGVALAPREQHMGLGVTAVGQKTRLRFDLAQRQSAVGRFGSAMLWGSYHF